MFKLRTQHSWVSNRDRNWPACIFQELLDFHTRFPKTLSRCSPIYRFQVDAITAHPNHPVRWKKKNENNLIKTNTRETRVFRDLLYRQSIFFYLTRIASTFVRTGADSRVGNSLDETSRASVSWPYRYTNLHQNRARWPPVISSTPPRHDRALVLERLTDRWQAHRPDVTVENGRSVHLDHSYIVLVRGRIEIRMDTNFNDGEIQSSRLFRRLEIVFAESHSHVSRFQTFFFEETKKEKTIFKF